MDILFKHRQKQFALWLLVGITAILANLPRDLAARLHLQTEYLLGVLGLLIVLALFLFVRFSFFFLTILLIVGANLPDRWSAGLGVDKFPLIVALAVMILGSLVNQVSKIIPSGLEARPREKHPEGVRAMMAAIPRGQVRSVKTILAMNIDPNDFDEHGRTPLMAAAQAGQNEIIEVLIAAGAEIDFKSPDGLTAKDIALAAGQMAAATLLQQKLAAGQTPPAIDQGADSILGQAQL